MESKESPKLMVSISGIRGIVGESLQSEDTLRFAMALGTKFQGGRIVVSRDSRPSGGMLRHAVIAGLLATGCTIEDIGIASTPTCGVAVRQLQARGGIQITASHNPAPWNGLKLFGPDGAVLDSATGKSVVECFQQNRFRRVDWQHLGKVGSPPEISQAHIRLVCDTLGVSQIFSANFHVLLDANGGAGGHIGIEFLDALGCTIDQIGCDCDGYFQHEPEPVPAHLTGVAESVRNLKPQIGFVLDPDADRLALIDENGNCVSEEITLALAVQFRLSRIRGPVVINMSTSRMVEDLAKTYRCECFRSAVGEANVVAEMRRSQAVIGGEGNGGVIDPRVGWVRDPLVGMGMILQLMAESKKSLSQLVSELPRYEMVKTKITIDQNQLPQRFSALIEKWNSAKIDRLDGLRFDWEDRWIHIRASNTEPVVRIIAESPTTEETKLLCSEAESILTGS